ncbi:hypothetical protein [Pseudoalteromonas luteoviolacea]|uniref:Uncharacterized protein n=1 Tax=Pseudoalteromonas luteoviolacea H33 TaxID=1365251 RepID=A0A167GC65_9GAMM|nr:hypothetical protein [Pseudoalteromonas luteoviolacea]KZN54875.1 hypothetical protein N476_07650 [Pseudoalteromonas luteoviolacea H33]KZN77043.1 hypothetical protein N477_13095 [Pseudoalteromonas luteoviolacea H33-S]MBQ4879735.1 hypothetical protein [Pseudoalteromonas luteoviolacea]MBQ4908797.1 hypothetical protein [Pseudoalteromonas luteoviolacea]
MNSLLAFSLILPSYDAPMIGQLYLQAPAVEYYFTRETGVATRAEKLEVGKLVEKGEELVRFKPDTDSGASKVYISNTKGYIEFIKDTQSMLESGELVAKVSSDHAFGNYYFDKHYDLSNISQSVWLCTDKKPVKFNVDGILKNSLLVSVELAQIRYSELTELSTGKVLLYANSSDCG